MVNVLFLQLVVELLDMGSHLFNHFFTEEFVLIFLKILGDLEGEQQGILFLRLN